MSSETEIFEKIKEIIWSRQETFRAKLDMTMNWDHINYIIAMNGKLGNINDAIKMLNLGKYKNYKEYHKDLQILLGDMFIYLFIICQTLEIEPYESIIKSFNKKSAEINSDIKL